MKHLFAVRHRDDKQAVGFFFTTDAMLPYAVEEITDANDCEYQIVYGHAGFAWSSAAPRMGEELASAELERIERSVELTGDALAYFEAANDRGWIAINWMDSRSYRKRNKLPPEDRSVRKIYFIKAGGFIKIGISNDVRSRLRALSTSHYDDLALLGIIPNATEAHEQELHQRFATLRTRGEWFKAEPALLQYIESLPK